MKTFAELCRPINEQCSPATSGASVYVGLEHISSGAFFLNRYGSPSDVQSAKSRFHQGDILYGKLRPYLDKAVIAPCDGICSTDILVFRPNPNVCPAYLLGLIHSNDFRTHADQTTNGVNHPRTSWVGLSTFRHDLPHAPEQLRIAATLWKIQRGVSLQDTLIAAARDLKRSAMQQIFSHGLRSESEKETEIGSIPKSWHLRSLESSRVFLQYGTSARCDYNEKGNPVIRIPNVIDGDVSAHDLKWCQLTEKEVESLLLAPGDVLFIRTNAVRERVGTCAVYEGQPKQALFASYLIRARLKEEELHPKFLQYFTATKAGLAQLGGRASPAADGKFNVNTKTIDSLLVPTPSIEEQKEIVAILRTLDAKITLHARKRAAFLDLFQTLLNQLMTAQIRVNRLDIDTSEVEATPTE